MRFHISCSKFVLAAVLSSALSASAKAQYRVPPNQAYYPPAQTQAVVQPVAVPQAVPVGVPVPIGGPAYPYGYAQTPVNGALTGLADLTTAQGQYLQQIQQAKLAQEDVTRARIDTRRKLQEEMAYEYKNRPTSGKLLAEEQAARLQRSRNNPPSTVIWSGVALNDLLGAIQDAETNLGVRGASVPLDPDSLQFINVTAGTTPGSVGLFRQGRPLRWTLPLLEDRFTPFRDKIEMLSATAVKSIVAGRPDNKAIRDLLAAISSLKDEVTAATKDQTPSDNIRSMRYVTNLKEGAQALTDPNALFFLNGKWQAKGSTVPELIQNLSLNGLKFAPAIEGDEPFYTALYRAILNCDASIQRLVRAN